MKTSALASEIISMLIHFKGCWEPQTRFWETRSTVKKVITRQANEHDQNTASFPTCICVRRREQIVSDLRDNGSFVFKTETQPLTWAQLGRKHTLVVLHQLTSVGQRSWIETYFWQIPIYTYEARGVSRGRGTSRITIKDSKPDFGLRLTARAICNCDGFLSPYGRPLPSVYTVKWPKNNQYQSCVSWRGLWLDWALQRSVGFEFVEIKGMRVSPRLKNAEKTPGPRLPWLVGINTSVILVLPAMLSWRGHIR